MNLQHRSTEPLAWWQTPRFIILAALVSIIPLLWPTIPPLTDLPGHMGRYSVQLGIADHPILGTWYEFRWSLIGNLGIDLLVIPLAPIFGLELAVKLIIIAIPALTVTGFLLISRELHGRISPTTLFALPLAYSYPFQFGFANFTLSMALALNLFAFWLWLGRTGRISLRAAMFTPLSCLLWICHVFGWGVFGILAFCAEMTRQYHGSGNRKIALARAIVACLPLALPLLFIFFWRSGNHDGADTGDWLNAAAKLSGLTMVLRDRWIALDLSSAIVLYLLIFKSLRDRDFAWSPTLAFIAAALFALFIAMPQMVFGSAYADMRLAPFMLAFAVIALRPKPGDSRRRSATVAILGLAFFLVRIAATTASYWFYDRSYDQTLAALDHMPVGARVVAFVGRPCHYNWSISRLNHLPAIALVRRRAFSNDQWSIAGSQLMTPHYEAAGWFGHDPSQTVTGRQCNGEPWLPIATAFKAFPREAFDYLWLIDPPAYDPRLLRDMTPVWRDGTGVLLKINRPATSR